MRPNRPSFERTFQLLLWAAGSLVVGAHLAHAGEVILHLRNGDRILGTIVAEDTNRVTIATSWIKDLAVPLSAIQSREAVTNAPPPVAIETRPAVPTQQVAAPKPATPPPATPPVAGSNVVAVAKPPPSAVGSNVVAAVKPPPPAAPKPAPKPPTPKHWKANVSVGSDMQFGAHDRYLYHAGLNLTYEQPYKSNPKKFFRSTLGYVVNYGKTDGTTSANDMNGTVKTDFDVGRNIYVYNLDGVGYDEIRKIDLQYQVGPGMGYHLFMRTNFVMNIEGGVSYQVEERSSSPDVKNSYYRLANDITWKITSRITLVEKAEFVPRTEDLGTYHTRVESTLSFGIWKNISLILSLLDLYDTSPANGVDNNELTIHSAVGVAF